MGKQITIIVAAFNMECCLGRCLESLLIPEANLVEVIVVNDGSTDRTSDIAHEYRRRYPSTIKVIDKENGNYGSCVNRGLIEATGRYVKLLDADDWFDSASFSELVGKLPGIDADVIYTSYVECDSDGRVISGPKPASLADTDPDMTYSLTQLLDAGAVDPGAGQQVICYSREFLRQHPVKLTEGISYTDNQWCTVPMCAAATVRIPLSRPLYHYNITRDGQTMSRSRERELMGDRLLLLGEELDFVTAVMDSPGINKEFLTVHFERFLRFVYIQVLTRGYKEYYEKLAMLDRRLETSGMQAYHMLGHMRCAPLLAYCPVAHWRTSGRSPAYRLPLLPRLLRLPLLSRLSSLLSPPRTP